MIPELFLALAGVPGDCFVIKPFESPLHPTRFAVNEIFAMSNAEQAQISRLLKVGLAINCLRKFVDLVHGDDAADDDLSHGFSKRSSDRNRTCAYLRALANSLSSEILSSYEELLVELEREVLRARIEPHAIAIEGFLGKWTIALPGLCEALKRVIEHREDDRDRGFMKGAKLIDEVQFRYRACGSFETKEMLRKVRRAVMGQFYKHCFAWMAFGTLTEDFLRQDRGRDRQRRGGSFFIGRVCDEEEEAMMDVGVSAGIDEFSNHKGSFQDDDYLENAKELPSDGGAASWRDAFAVKIEQTPKRMSASDAEAVHFVGRCVRAMRLHKRALELRRRRNFDSHGSVNFNKANIDSFLDMHASETARDIENIVLGISQTDDELSQPINDGEDDFDDFSALAIVVNRAKVRVSKRLGEIIDAETYALSRFDDDFKTEKSTSSSSSSSFVMDTFASLRNFFLLQRGDIFASLLDDENSIFVLPEHDSSAMKSSNNYFASKKRVDAAWQDALAMNSFDGASERFSLKRLSSSSNKNTSTLNEDEVSKGNEIPSYDGFHDVYMIYERVWPVGLLVTDFALERYGTIFKSLFRLRRARSALSRVWQNISRHNRTNVRETSGAFDYSTTDANGLLLKARSAIDFTLRNWEQYASEDVISHRWSLFTKSMDSHNNSDFEKATKSHREFIVSVSRELFVNDGGSRKHNTIGNVEKTIAETANLAFALEFLSREYRDINGRSNSANDKSDEDLDTKLYHNEHIVTKAERIESRALECNTLLCAALRADVLGISDVSLGEKVNALLFRLEFNQ